MATETEKKPPLRPVRTIKKMVFTIAAIVVIAGGCFFGGIVLEKYQASQVTEPEITSADLTQQLQGINELSTVKYIYTNMGQFQQSNDFYGFKIPFTTKKFIVSYDGSIKAGVDLSKTEITLNETEIKVHLPEAEIFSHEIIEDSLQIFDESKNIFNPISIEDYNQFQIDQKDVIEAKATDSGLLVEAKEKAKIAVEGLLSPIAKEEEKTLLFE